MLSYSLVCYDNLIDIVKSEPNRKDKEMNILFLCGHYAFPTAANSICVQNMAEEFQRKGHKVFVLAKGCEYSGEKEVINGVTVWKHYGDAYGKVVVFFNEHRNWFCTVLFAIIQLFRYLYVVWFYPVTSPKDTWRLYQRAQEIIDKEGIDIVVATFMPYEAIKAALNLKERYGNSLKVVTYHLDLLTNPNNKSSLISSVKKRQAEKAIKKEFLIVDRVLLPNTAPKIDNAKIEYVDFPLYIPEASDKGTDSYTFDQQDINIAIAGSLDNSNRNPLYFCKLIGMLPKIHGKTVKLHVWGRLSGVELQGLRNVEHHGMADVAEVPSILRGADFLLNVGNAITYKMIPSKIFQMFAAKKNILFCVRSDKDKSRPYFERYGYVSFIEEYVGNLEGDLKKITAFIDSHYQKTVEVDDSLFISSTPAYICDRIIEKCEK